MKYKDFKTMSQDEMKQIKGGYVSEGNSGCNYTQDTRACSCGAGWTDCKCQANNAQENSDGGRCIAYDAQGNCFSVGTGAADCKKVAN